MRRRLTPWLLPAAILVAWELASRSGLLSARILPEPAAVAAAFWRLLRSGELAHHVAVSTVRAFSALALGGGVLGFIRFDVPLRHGPQQPAAAIQAADEGHVDCGEVDFAIWLHGFRQAGKNQAARGGLLDLPQPPPAPPTRPSGSSGHRGAGHLSIVARPAGGSSAGAWPCGRPPGAPLASRSALAAGGRPYAWRPCPTPSRAARRPERWAPPSAG